MEPEPAATRRLDVAPFYHPENAEPSPALGLFTGFVGGRQYGVIAAGGHGRFGATLGDALVAFALAE
jgi:hypothetical protein